MTPFDLFLIAALTGLGAFTGLLVKAMFAHYESDLAYSRRTGHRAVETAEKATAKVEELA